jgi:hypothetical protein
MLPVIKYQSLRRSIKRLSLKPHALGTGSSLGAQSYLRLKWADAGFDFETSSLSALETTDKGYEAAETIKRIEAAKRAAEGASAAKSSGSHTSSTKSSSSGVPPSTSTRKPRLTEEEREKFRAEDRCFYCREIGHRKCNCPRVHRAPAPKIRSGAVTVDGDPYAYLKSISVYE